MKKVNFKMRNVAIVFACCLAATMMTACGGGSKQQNQAATPETTKQTTPAPSESLKAKDVTVNNWQEVVKANREGLEIPLPDGWTVAEAKPETGSSSRIVITFNIGGTTTAEQFGQMLLDATKAISKNGNHKINVTEKGAEEGEPIEKISDAATFQGVSFPAEWIFTVNYKYTVYCYANEKQIAINL